jgi:hypothetical protein
MIKIYCLVDPRDNTPFYVGATKQKLRKRLFYHMTKYNIHWAYKPRKEKLISILNEHLLPIIAPIILTEAINADTMERLAYQYLKSLGYNLLQAEYRFTYQSNGWVKKNIQKQFGN